MLCPYCSKEMEEGIIESPNAIVWEKGLVKGSPIRLRNAISKDGIMLSKRPWHELYNPKVIAYAARIVKKSSLIMMAKQISIRDNSSL